MDIEAALFDAIRDDPDDDAPRLALADWLMEGDEPAGQARGEFIAVQCRLARAGLDDPDRGRLRARQAALLHAHRRAWCGAVEDRVGRTACTFHRGLLHVELEHDGLVRLTPADSSLCEAWRWVEAITLGHSTAAADAQQLADAGWFRDLAALSLNRVDEPVLEGLTAAAPRLRRLCLGGPGLMEREVRLLARLPVAARLTSLAFEQCGLTRYAVWALAENWPAGAIRELALHGALDPLSVECLVVSPRLRSLRLLDVETVPLGASIPPRREEALVLARSWSLPELKSLRLRVPLLGDEGAMILAGASWLGQLNALCLADCDIGAVGLSALTADGRLDGLRALDLDGNPIGVDGVRSLASAWGLRRLETLGLARTGLRADACRVLGGSLNCPRLRALVLDSNPIACDGAAALAEAPRLAGLRRLTLSCCLIGHRGVHALARSAALGGLAELDLSSNPIGDACRALASSAALTGLHALDLSDITPPVSRGTADRLHERFGDDLTLPG